MPAITIPGGASTPELSAHLAVPPVGEAPWPAVVVLHEMFGLTDDIRQQADRLAAAGYYGMLPKRLDETLTGACPVVGSYGARDPELRGAAGKLEAALSRGGVAHDVMEYPDAGHSFLNRPNLGPAGPLLRVAGIGYHELSAEDAWGRILRFFATHLDAPANTQVRSAR